MFQEAFTAGNAEISPFSQNESNLFSKVGDILYFLKPVIMETSGFLATARTGLFSSVCFNVNLQKRVRLNYFSD